MKTDCSSWVVTCPMRCLLLGPPAWTISRRSNALSRGMNTIRGEHHRIRLLPQEREALKPRGGAVGMVHESWFMIHEAVSVTCSTLPYVNFRRSGTSDEFESDRSPSSTKVCRTYNVIDCFRFLFHSSKTVVPRTINIRSTRRLYRRS